MTGAELEKKMRVYETANDNCVLPEMHIVVRLDGKKFSKLTNEYYEKPFSDKFKNIMAKTTETLMKESGFSIVYAYCQSDEISLLLHRLDETFSRKPRKIISTLAGLASATFSLEHGSTAVFDARISQLPKEHLVLDYFKWRQEDSINNCLNGYCYWTLRNLGDNKLQATKKLQFLTYQQKEELLFNLRVNYSKIPLWQKRGFGAFWETYKKESVNPLTNEKVWAERNKISIDYEIPSGYNYEDYLLSKMYRTGMIT